MAKKKKWKFGKCANRSMMLTFAVMALMVLKVTTAAR